MTAASGEQPRRVRVLHFIDSGGLYGAESVILALSREMQAHEGYEPVIGCITSRSDPTPELMRVAAAYGIEAHRIEIENWHLFRDIRGARRQLARLGIRLIHCHGYKPSVFGYLLGKLTGIAVIATCHLWFVDKTAPLKMRLMIAIEQYLYRNFPAVVSVSDDISSILVRAGLDARRVHLIRNGIVLADYERVPAASGNPDGSEPCVRVVNVGRLTAQKSQDTLVAAAARLRNERPDIRIAIVGDGELRDALARQIDAENVADRVSLPGFQRDVKTLLFAADVFALPSIDEGMPMSLLEAVAARVPAIVTQVGDVGKLIEHEVSGLVVPMRDPAALASAILRLANEPDEATRYAERAWQKMNALYSSTQMYRDYDRVYRQVLGR